MTHDELDPRRDKLIAALYGELSPEEEKEFFQLMSQDDELRSEWEELKAARAFLKHGEQEEHAPSFVFVPPGTPEREEPRVGFWEKVRGFVFSPAGGFAVATAALVVLIATGFRVDRVENGLAFRFGAPEKATPGVETLAQGREGVPPQGVPLDGVPLQPGPGSDITPGGDVSPELAAAQPRYLTRADLNSYGDNLTRMMSAMLSNYEQQRNGELGFVLKMLYDDLMRRQQRDYSDLRSQIQRVGYGLVLDRAAEDQLESLIKRGERYELTPVSPTTSEQEVPPTQNEVDEND